MTGPFKFNRSRLFDRYLQRDGWHPEADARNIIQIIQIENLRIRGLCVVNAI